MWDCIRYYLKNTGIPVNFGITIAVALVVGAVVAGQTFYLFTVENLKQFGALKAIGVTNVPPDRDDPAAGRSPPASLGFALGTGMAATFFEITLHKLATRGIVLMWQCVGAHGRLHPVRRRSSRACSASGACSCSSRPRSSEDEAAMTTELGRRVPRRAEALRRGRDPRSRRSAASTSRRASGS